MRLRSSTSTALIALAVVAFAIPAAAQSYRSRKATSDSQWLEKCQKKCPESDKTCNLCCQGRADDLMASCPRWCGGTSHPKAMEELAKRICTEAQGGKGPISQPVLMICISSYLIMLPSVMGTCTDSCWKIDWKNFDPQTGCRSDTIFGKNRPKG